MQNGGWLDSYANGGTMQEHQENYNDSYVALPKGFVGMGNNTKGRNYSPAWGGQFQEGGLIPMAQNGEKKKLNIKYPKSTGYAWADETLKNQKKKQIEAKKIKDKIDAEINAIKKEYKLDDVTALKWYKAQQELKKGMTDVHQDNRTDYVRKLDDEKGKAKERKKQIKKNILAPLDVATDIMQLGNFVPHPYGQAIGQLGNIGGVAIDAYQAADDFSEGDYVSGGINTASVVLPFGLDAKTFRRNSKYLQPGQPLYPLSPQANLPANATFSQISNVPRVNYIEPFTKVKGMTDQSLLANRALLGTLGAETLYDSGLTPKFQKGGLMFKDPSIPQVDYSEPTYSYPLRDKLYPGEDEYFKANPNVGGMAAEDNTVIINPYSKLTDEQKEGIRINETARLAMRNGYRRPDFELTPEQQEAFKNYSTDIQDQKETIIGRILSGDTSAGNVTPEQKKYAEQLKKVLKLQNGDAIGSRPEDMGIREITEFEKAYINSPRFTELSRKQGDTPEITQRRRDTINNFNIDRDVIRVSEGPSYISADEEGTPKFYLSPDKGDWPSHLDINAHEMGHFPYNTGNLNFPENTYREIQSRNKEFIKSKKTGVVDENIEHDINPNEVRADKNQLLYQLKKLGIYDATKDGDINQEQLDEFKNSGEWNRLQRLYDDADILWLINNVAQNTPNEELNIAQTGASIPGSVGFTYARTQGIPSEGPYAKKTMPSAQNGQEMQYYREGLDWKPKTISQNGGWLDAYGDNVYKAQTGKNIRVKNTDGSISVMNTDSPEYRKMYNTGQIQNAANTEDSTYWGGVLDEVPIMGKPREKGFWEQYADKIAEENRDAGLLGAIIGTPISAVTSLPQLAMTKGINNLPTLFGQQAWNDGKMQRPSEALDVQNPYGAFAVDLFTDPINYVGAGLADDALKLTSKGKNLLKKGFGKPVKVAEQNIVPIKDMFIQPTPLKASETLPKELEPYLSSYVKPISDEEEVFRMSMGPEYKAKKLADDTVYLDSEGNIISAPKKTYTPFIEDEDIKYINAKKNKNINVVPEERSIIRSSSVIDMNDIGPIQKQGGIIKDDRGQWAHPGEITEIGSNNITMQGVPFDVLGISDTGDTKLMKPGKNYKFKGKKVTEFPMAKNGLRQEQKGLVNLDNLTNFTNYNKPQPGGWLNKYN
jgi:hypothetical protein